VIEGLREGVDLIVVAAGGKRQKLLAEFVEPMRSLRKINRSGLDARGLRIHANHLVVLRLDGNRMDIVAPEVLNQRHARSLVLDQQCVIVCRVPPLAMQLNHLALEVRIFQALAEDIETCPEADKRIAMLTAKFKLLDGGITSETEARL